MENWNIKCKFLVRVFAILTTYHTTICLNGNPNKASQGYALFLFNWIKKKKKAAWQLKARAKRMARTKQKENNLMGINASPLSLTHKSQLECVSW